MSRCVGLRDSSRRHEQQEAINLLATTLTTSVGAPADPTTVNCAFVWGSSHSAMTNWALAHKLALIPPSLGLVLTLDSAISLLSHCRWVKLGGTGQASLWWTLTHAHAKLATLVGELRRQRPYQQRLLPMDVDGEGLLAPASLAMLDKHS